MNKPEIRYNNSMAKKKKIEITDTKPKSRSIQKMTFTVWFKSKVAAKILKDYQISEISVFFKKQGLKDMEEKERFESKLNRFLGL